jgi:hypothetical protein
LMIGTGASTGSLTLKIARVAGRTHNPARAFLKHKHRLLQGWHVLFSFQRTSNEKRRT